MPSALGIRGVIRNIMMASFEALDLINIGLFVTTASGYLLLANSTAEQILANRDGLELTRRGELGMLPKSDPRFLMLLRQVAESPTHTTAEPSGGILVVPRRSGKRALNLLVRPAS